MDGCNLGEGKGKPMGSNGKPRGKQSNPWGLDGAQWALCIDVLVYSFRFVLVVELKRGVHLLA